MEKTILSFEICMDILDWFDDPYYDYIHHILLAKLDGEQRIMGAMDTISNYCLDLIEAHKDSECAYPAVS